HAVEARRQLGGLAEAGLLNAERAVGVIENTDAAADHRLAVQRGRRPGSAQAGTKCPWIGVVDGTVVGVRELNTSGGFELVHRQLRNRRLGVSCASSIGCAVYRVRVESSDCTVETFYRARFALVP